jgi:hypothetical protein
MLFPTLVMSHIRVHLPLLAAEDKWYDHLLANITQDRQRIEAHWASLFNVVDTESAFAWGRELEGLLVRSSPFYVVLL